MAKVFLFNPYTGTPRHPSDIASDPEGLAILDDNEPLRAALVATPAPVEPVAWLRDFWGPDCGPYYEIHKSADMTWRSKDGWTPLFAAPVAATPESHVVRAPAPAPQGWKLVPVEPTPEMLWSLFGSFVWQLTAGERKRYAAMLAATPPAAAAPLTDEQIDKTAKRVIPVAAYMGMFEYAAFSKEDADRTVRHFARAIEAAHGIGASTKESDQ